jgi:hypothetical protein
MEGLLLTFQQSGVVMVPTLFIFDVMAAPYLVEICNPCARPPTHSEQNRTLCLLTDPKNRFDILLCSLSCVMTADSARPSAYRQQQSKAEGYALPGVGESLLTIHCYIQDNGLLQTLASAS